MMDSAPRGWTRRDLLCLVVFGLGSLLAVSTVINWQRSEVLAGVDSDAKTAVMRGLRSMLGWGPLFFLAAGLAALFGAAVASRREFPLGRSALGILGVTLGLACLAGLFSETAGGALGAFLRNLLPGVVGPILALLVGLSLAGFSVWKTWFPDLELKSKKPVEARQVEGPGTKDEPEVTLAEAEGLHHRQRPPRQEPSLSEFPRPSQDVRLRGGVPEGARALGSTHDETESERTPEAAQGGAGSPAPAARADESAPEDLAAEPAPSVGAGVVSKIVD